LWTIDFRVLPILLGHWSPKRAWIMSLAPLPLYFSFRYKQGVSSHISLLLFASSLYQSIRLSTSNNKLTKLPLSRAVQGVSWVC
jgi:hypothetical protein